MWLIIQLWLQKSRLRSRRFRLKSLHHRQFRNRHRLQKHQRNRQRRQWQRHQRNRRRRQWQRHQRNWRRRQWQRHQRNRQRRQWQKSQRNRRVRQWQKRQNLPRTIARKRVNQKCSLLHLTLGKIKTRLMSKMEPRILRKANLQKKRKKFFIM